MVGDLEESGDAFAYGARALAVGDGHEDGVVAGESAGDAVNLLGLEGAGDGAGGSGLGQNDDQVAGFAHAAQERTQGIERGDALFDGEVVGAVPLDCSECAQIPRQNGLRGPDPAPLQGEGELGLRGGAGLAQQGREQGAPGGGGLQARIMPSE